jgi:Flp pilus assembly protein TadG
MSVVRRMLGMRWVARRAECGAVTAEVAVVLPVLLAILVFGVWMAGVVVENIRCIDAARDVARAVARGEPPQSAQQLVSRTAPEGATFTITKDGPDIQVTVTADVTPRWPLLAKLPPIQVKGQATIQSEPTISGGLR